MERKVDLLPRDMGSLSRGVPPARPGTLFLLGNNCGMRVAPDAGFPLTFGRNEDDVHVCVGAGDKFVSRRQGLITRAYSCWMLRNTGRVPIRFPGSHLVLSGDEAELPAGYTPLFIVSPRQEHLLEVRIAAPAAAPGGPVGPANPDEDETHDQRPRELDEDERLVLVCLAQRYLRNEPQPQPLTWAQVAFELSALPSAKPWTAKRAAHVVAKVRKRLSSEDGVRGLLEDEVLPPVGNALNHNLITDLLITTTIGKPDLALLTE
jgi:hypothetical protein